MKAPAILLLLSLALAGSGFSQTPAPKKRVTPVYDMSLRFIPTDPLQTPRAVAAFDVQFGECDLLLELPEGSRWLAKLEVDSDETASYVEVQIADPAFIVTSELKKPLILFDTQHPIPLDGTPKKILQMAKGALEVSILRKNPEPVPAAVPGSQN